MTLYIENLKDRIKSISQVNECSQATGNKINQQESVVFLNINDKLLKEMLGI